MSGLWDLQSIKRVEARLAKEAEEREVRRKEAKILTGGTPEFRNRFRREFLLTDPIQRRRRRRRLVAYILSLIGILLLLLANILAN